MPKFKVISSSPTFGSLTKDSINLLTENNCEVTLLEKEVIQDPERFSRSIKDADALIVGIEIVNQNLLENANKLKVIAKHGIGMDNIDLLAAKQKGIIVKNVPDASTDAVADYTIGLLIDVARHITKTFIEIKDNQWNKKPGFGFAGKTLGVIGTGKIGRSVIQRAKGFQMKILAFDKFPDYDYARDNEIKYTELANLYRESDYITIHTSLNPETKHLIDLNAFKQMKPNLIIVNTARGGIISEEDLITALKENWIAGAALDVFEKEPGFDRELLNQERFLASSHTAAYTFESLNYTGIETAKNILSVLYEKKEITQGVIKT